MFGTFFFFHLTLYRCIPFHCPDSTVVDTLGLLLVGTRAAARLLAGGRCSHGHSRKCRVSRGHWLRRAVGWVLRCENFRKYLPSGLQSGCKMWGIPQRLSSSTCHGWTLKMLFQSYAHKTVSYYGLDLRLPDLKVMYISSDGYVFPLLKMLGPDVCPLFFCWAVCAFPLTYKEYI